MQSHLYESTDNAELFIFRLLQVSALPRRDPLGSRKKDSTAARWRFPLKQQRRPDWTPQSHTGLQ